MEVELGVAVAVDDDEEDACSLSPPKAALMAEKKVMRVAVNFIMHTKFYDAVVVLSIVQRLACTVSSGRVGTREGEFGAALLVVMRHHESGRMTDETDDTVSVRKASPLSFSTVRRRQASQNAVVPRMP